MAIVLGLTGWVQPPVSAASAGVTVTLGTASGAAGTTVQVPVSISNLDGSIHAYGVRIQYPHPSLELVDIEGDLRALTQDDWHDEQAAGELAVAWVDESLTAPIAENGTLFTVTFRIKENTPAGPLSIQVDDESDSLEFVDADIGNIYAEAPGGGTVLVTAEPDVSIRLADVQGGPGQTVKVPVAFAAPLQAISAYGIEIAYPTEIVEVVGVESGATTVSAENWHVSAEDGTLRVAWVDESLSAPIEQSGHLFTIVFRMKQDAALGSRPLTVSTDHSLQFVNAAAEELLVQVLQQGTIEVTALQPPVVPSPGGGGQDRTVDVKLGASQGEAVASVPIKRSVSAKGEQIDSVQVDSGKAEQFVSLARENNQQIVRIVVTDLPGSPADEQRIEIPGASVDTLAEGDIQLTIQTPDVEISLSKESLRSMTAEGKDLYFRVVPINDEEARNEAAEHALQADVVLAAADGGPVVLLGKPMTIETNYSGFKTKLVFPLTGLELPDNPVEIERLLTGLAVYIEHSDGEKKLQRGTVQFDAEGLPVGIEIEIDKFSTFSVIHAKQLEATEFHAYMNGYPDETFRPDKGLTRAELAAVLSRVVKDNNVAASETAYTDVPGNHWAYDAIAAAGTTGLMQGDEQSFRPDAYVTRGELAAVVSRMLSLSLAAEPDNSPAWADVRGHWAASYIAAAEQSGLLEGYGDGTFRPEHMVTRAELAAMFNRALGRPAFAAEQPAWTDVSTRHWAYTAIESATHALRVVPIGNGGQTIEIIE
ncbi:hypothetical protein D3P08_13970 [Paenibacillus nanensis]|uniref:SLH domain-containing protein n=2 Tax=Paenibacillus nanensis TaxID=393251 RepID=A0A3A1UXD8_9BACL|nr:hypothetical protein D3P08_13970 [Paenibacillus nanensis]